MSETETKPTEATTRTLEQVTTEYSQACAILGDKQFKASLLNSEIQNVYVKISELNAEAIVIKAANAPVEMKTVHPAQPTGLTNETA